MEGESDDDNSSSFVQTPPPNELSQATVHGSTNESLKHQLETQSNQFELERLQWQRESNAMEKEYIQRIQQLEASLRILQHPEEEKTVVNQLQDDFEKRIAQIVTENKTKIQKLELEVQSKEQDLQEYKLTQRNTLDKLTLELDESKLIIENLQENAARFENEKIQLIDQNKQLQQDVRERDNKILELQTGNTLKGSIDITDEMTTVNKMFQDQMKYTKELEERNLQQDEALHESLEIQKKLQEEIQELQLKVKELESLEKDYQESQLELLEAKSKIAEWELDMEGKNDNDEDIENDEVSQNKVSQRGPAEIIADWKLFKQENIMLVAENNKLNISNNNLKILNEELAMERNQLLELNKNYENNIINLKKLNYEIDQQKLLSMEECKLLKKQINQLNNSDALDHSSNLEDVEKNFELLVDDYKNKTDDLTNELKKLNEQMLNQTQNENSKKRKLSDNSTSLTYYSQRINEMKLENVTLHRELDRMKNLNRLLDEKLRKLILLKEKKIRILQLRDNPLSQDQFIKKTELDLLRRERDDLLEQLKGIEPATVPASSLKSLEFNLSQKDKEIFKANKKFQRLKEIFNSKSMEFIDVVNTILGFKIEFQPNDKVKIYSCFQTKKYLTIDLVKNTLTSNIQLDNWNELLSTWIEKRGQMPCFLATITLKLWELNQ